MTELPTRITIVFPNYKMNPRLCGNTRGSAFLKREAQRQAKADSQRLCQHALSEAGTDAEQFLTNDYKYHLDQALPLKVICRRVYSGHSNRMDKENCLLGFKYYVDGIAVITCYNDRDFDLELEQVREKTGHRLEIELIPAWAVKKGEAA
jgi:hypothetical protein